VQLGIAPEATAKPDFDPSYAIDFWDLTNRQDWAACESVQRGLTSPRAKPGPLNPAEDAVYQFVGMVARGYLGQSVWTTAGASGGSFPQASTGGSPWTQHATEHAGA
jgi:hypothetical protein